MVHTKYIEFSGFSEKYYFRFGKLVNVLDLSKCSIIPNRDNLRSMESSVYFNISEFDSA